MDHIPKIPMRASSPLLDEMEFHRPPWWRWLIAFPFGIAMTGVLIYPVSELCARYPAYLQLVAQSHAHQQAIVADIR